MHDEAEMRAASEKERPLLPIYSRSIVVSLSVRAPRRRARARLVFSFERSTHFFPLLPILSLRLPWPPVSFVFPLLPAALPHPRGEH